MSTKSGIYERGLSFFSITFIHYLIPCVSLFSLTRCVKEFDLCNSLFLYVSLFFLIAFLMDLGLTHLLLLDKDTKHPANYLANSWVLILLLGGILSTCAYSLPWFLKTYYSSKEISDIFFGGSV